MIKIGKVLKPKGLVGTVKTECYLEDNKHLKNINKFFIDKKEFTLKEVYFSGEFCYLTFNEIDTIEKAEVFKFKEIFIEEKDLPKKDENEYYVSDLIGKEVLVFNGENIDDFDIKKCEFVGLLRDVTEYAKSDVFIVGKWELPNTEDLFLGVVNDKIILKQKRFKELTTYDDE